MKACKQCGEPKPLTDYSVDARSRDGRQGTCKTCDAARAKERREALKRDGVLRHCRKCKQDKAPSEFRPHPRSRDGLARICRACKQETDRLAGGWLAVGHPKLLEEARRRAQHSRLDDDREARQADQAARRAIEDRRLDHKPSPVEWYFGRQA